MPIASVRTLSRRITPGTCTAGDPVCADAGPCCHCEQAFPGDALPPHLFLTVTFGGTPPDCVTGGGASRSIDMPPVPPATLGASASWRATLETANGDGSINDFACGADCVPDGAIRPGSRGQFLAFLDYKRTAFPGGVATVVEQFRVNAASAAPDSDFRVGGQDVRYRRLAFNCLPFLFQISVDALWVAGTGQDGFDSGAIFGRRTPAGGTCLAGTRLAFTVSVTE